VKHDLGSRFIIFGSIVVALAGGFASASSPAGQAGAATYTAAQAEAGKAAYEENCAGCHVPQFVAGQDQRRPVRLHQPGHAADDAGIGRR
jgi:mono/diheme cytochrome c family protein